MGCLRCLQARVTMCQCVQTLQGHEAPVLIPVRLIMRLCQLGDQKGVWGDRGKLPAGAAENSVSICRACARPQNSGEGERASVLGCKG